MKHLSHRSNEDGSSWPYTSLFFFGFFGAKTSAGKRLAWWTAAAVLTIALTGFVLQEVALQAPALRALLALMMVSAVVALVWANTRYISQLDDLERRIQIEAMAFSYGCVMTLAFAWFALFLVQAGAWTVNPTLYLLWLVMAEPIRGLALVRIAQRYR